ncbi:hypothetical protein CBR_g23322 [Chara braunii]|uniref:Myb/SANT-like DNA-binding domain-containing protein n=1 Tax=Chara braunii TaxID=69332 RepID=A0A388L3V8_CHABU|nr:hypothetical protein CBR_g23322 [Chara braunii]|eukprot:GBG76991.1 hypothetical protein CBR_g23322 [Chara braunii]
MIKDRVQKPLESVAEYRNRFYRMFVKTEREGAAERIPPSQQQYLDPRTVRDLAFFGHPTAEQFAAIREEEEEEESTSSDEDEDAREEGGDSDEELGGEDETPEEGSYSEHSEGEQSEEEEEDEEGEEEHEEEPAGSDWEAVPEEALHTRCSRRLPCLQVSEVARLRGGSVDAGTDFFDVGDDRDGREVWKEHRRDLRARREETITRGVERLCVGDREKETDDPPAEADNEDKDDNDGEGGEGGGGYVSLSLQSDMVRKGGKSKPSDRNSPPRAKKSQGKGRGGDDGGDAEKKRNFWSVALIRAKRDQDAHMQGMGHAYARMKPRGWKWQDVAQRLKNVGVDRDAEKCGKKWDNLMQQFKKVHHFQSPSGGADFFQLMAKERASRGFNFIMDRAIYDEIEGSTGMNHTIHPKNVADTGASGGVRLPLTSDAVPESVADGDGGAGREDDDEGSTQGSSQATGTPTGFGKRKSTRQPTFDALTECMEKHGTLMASTMESASKRQCSIQVRQCEALKAEVEVQRKHYAASDEVSKLICHGLLEIAKAIRER